MFCHDTLKVNFFILLFSAVNIYLFDLLFLCVLKARTNNGPSANMASIGVCVCVNMGRCT